MTSLPDRLALVQETIHKACATARRDPETVGLIAVSKRHPPSAILRAHASGHLDFGENYAQELRDKSQDLRRTTPPIRWHFIGQIQSNKAKYIAPTAYRIHALEEVRHAQALARRASAELIGLVAVNVAREQSKGGVRVEEALERCAALDAIDGITIRGLMTLPPPQDDPERSAPHFEKLALLAEEGRAQGLELTELSMGMSQDYHVAIRYGATWIRVGTAIFGPRPS
ncbi:MAG: YggS family pyridoxal phosphate-dependent enzyme [Deltaproteobacteria bacterium]|nr:MAG: YggS family pyridoxal phosphate-dependent enzyme [Deltaproteobacteria bacterium]